MVEAAACNIPFIANDKIGTKLRISNNNAFLYKQRDIQDLYEKMKYLVENNEERVNM
jgi:spore maturation protein CgeB